MRKIIFAISVIAGVFLITTCTHKPFPIPKSAIITPPPIDSTHHDTTSTVPDTSVCFQRDVLPIFIGSCAKPGCHDPITNAEGYDLSTYSNIISKGLVKYNSSASYLYTICVSGEMPTYPTPKLDSTQLSFIKRWIEKGAPNDTNCIVYCDTNKYTFAVGVAPIMQKYCYGCHATAVAATSGKGVILDTYSGVLGQAQNGKLLGDLNHLSGFYYMPLGGAKLSDCQITQIKKWIDNGALNN